MGYLLFTFALAFIAHMLVLAPIDEYYTCQVNLIHVHIARLEVGPSLSLLQSPVLTTFENSVQISDDQIAGLLKA